MRLKTKSLFANAVVLTERALAELKRDGRQLDTRIREATSLKEDVAVRLASVHCPGVECEEETHG